MAGNSSNVRAGGAFIEIFSKDAAFQKSLAKIRNQLQSFGQSLRSIGTVGVGAGLGIVAPLALATKSFADAGSEINDMAARTGVGTDALQELGYAARQSGSSLGTVERGIRMMQKQAKAEGTSPEEMFMRMADQIGAIEDPTQRAAFALKHFGRVGTELIPMMANGRAGLEEMRQKARELGIVMSAEDVAAADELGDSLDSLWDTLGGIKNTIGAALAPALTSLANTITGVFSGVRAFIDNNRGLVQGILVGGIALTVIGGALIGLGVSLQVASFAVGGFMAVLTTTSAILTAVAGSPLLLVTAGVLALAAAFPQVREAAGGMFSVLSDGFGELGQIASETFGSMIEALTQGDIEAAANVLWAGLKVAWLAGTDELRRTWRTVSSDIATLGVDAFAGIRTAWVDLTQFMGDAWSIAWAGIKEVYAVGVQDFFDGLRVLSGTPLGTVATDRKRTDEQRRIGAKALLDEEIAGREAASKERLKQIEEERKESNKALDEELSRQNEKAANELKAAREALAAQRAAIAEKGGMLKNFNTGVKPGALDGGLSGVSLGSFSSRNIGQQSIAGLDKVTEATEATAENTEEIAAILRNGGVFT